MTDAPATLSARRRRHVAVLVGRWLLTVPCAITGFYLGLAVWGAIRYLNEHLCPHAYRVSGMCHAPWSWYVQQSALGLGAFVCGAMVVLMPTLIAPSHRRRVAIVFYLIGLTVAVFFWIPGMLLARLAAALGGAIALWRIQAALTKSTG